MMLKYFQSIEGKPIDDNFDQTLQELIFVIGKRELRYLPVIVYITDTESSPKSLTTLGMILLLNNIFSTKQHKQQRTKPVIKNERKIYHCIISRRK